MIGDTTHYFCEHNLRVQVSPFVYICLDMLYNAQRYNVHDK